MAPSSRRNSRRHAARTHRGEFHVADAGAGFRAGSGVADGEGAELGLIPEEDRIA